MASETDIRQAYPEGIAGPYPFYRRLQSEAPVYLDSQTGLYEVTDQALIRAAAAQPLLHSNRASPQLNRLRPIIEAMPETARFPLAFNLRILPS